MTEPVALYRRVLDHFSDLVDSIQADQWTAATPCEGWTVRDLIEHVIVRDERLAATVGGPPRSRSARCRPDRPLARPVPLVGRRAWPTRTAATPSGTPRWVS